MGEFYIENLYSDSALFFDRDCKVTGSLEERKRLRYVLKSVEAFMFKPVFQSIGSAGFGILFVLYNSLFLALIPIILISSSKVYFKKQLDSLKDASDTVLKIIVYFSFFVFYFYCTFFSLSEFTYSIFESFCIAGGIYFAFNKNIIGFLFVLMLSSINRESGVLMGILYPLINRSSLKYYFLPILAFLFLIVLNRDLGSCLYDIRFYLLTVPQKGQFTFFDIKEQGLLPFAKIFIQNFLPFLAFEMLLLSGAKLKREITRLRIFIYLYFVIFLFATPLQHMSIKLILIPIFILISVAVVLSRLERSE